MTKETTSWSTRVASFLRRGLTLKGASSVPNGPITLYGTTYTLLGLHYLGEDVVIDDELRQFFLQTQDKTSGLFIGPEMTDFNDKPDILHDREHLILHSTCTVLPLFEQFKIVPKYPIHDAHRFCILEALNDWLDSRNLKNAWFEGNNILFVGQLLVYLRNVEQHSGAQKALKRWFEWLDFHVDPKTGLWGTNGYCSPMEAVYGGYHQLLVYYYENQPLSNITGLVDTVLGLQHDDGGFNPNGNGGACEDVDSVDILVNCYKRLDYKRAEIRLALRRCMNHILEHQNEDGGFPYNRNQHQSHMGIPGTAAEPNVSCTFPTWFRIHTLALIAEVLPNDPNLKGIPFRFNRKLGMGWHSSPVGWTPISDAEGIKDKVAALRYNAKKYRKHLSKLFHEVRRFRGRLLRKLALKL